MVYSARRVASNNLRSFGRFAKRRPLALACIVLGILLIGLPFYPAIQFKAQQVASTHPTLQKILPSALKAPNTSDIPTSGYWLIIPSISVREEIIEGPDLSVLNKQEGVWHQTGDTQHNLVLAGHRFQYLPPNTHTFYNLNKLNPGDTITLVWDGKSLEYTVTKTSLITSDQVAILNPTSSPQLTLYTCSDWSEAKRYLVVATPLKK